MRANKNTITKPKIVNGGVASGQTNPIGGGGIGSEVATGNSNYCQLQLTKVPLVPALPLTKSH